MSIVEELKRRNVFKVAFAYVVVGWLLLQVSEILVPALHLPNWVLTATVFFLFIGFLPAMILLQNGNILQVPIRHFPRIAGTAKYGLWNRLLGPLMDCFAYLWMKKKYINYEIKDKG